MAAVDNTRIYIVEERIPSSDPNDYPQPSALDALGNWFSGLGTSVGAGVAGLTGTKSALGVRDRKAGFFNGIVGNDEGESEFEGMMRRKQAALKNAIEAEKKGFKGEKLVFHLKNGNMEEIEKVTPRSSLHAELLLEHQKRHYRQQAGPFAWLGWGRPQEGVGYEEPPPVEVTGPIFQRPALKPVAARILAEEQAAPTGGEADAADEPPATPVAAAPVAPRVVVAPKAPEPEAVQAPVWVAPAWVAPKVFNSYPGPITEEDENRLTTPPKPPPKPPTADQLQMRANLATPGGWMSAFSKTERKAKAMKKGDPAAWEYADDIFKGPTAQLEASAQKTVAKKQPKVLQRNARAASEDRKARTQNLSHAELLKMQSEAASDAASAADKPRVRSKIKLSALGSKRAPTGATGARLEDVQGGAAGLALGASDDQTILGFDMGEYWFKAADKIDPKEHIDWKDSNVAGIGSDEDKALRKMAAKTEEAWFGCGQTPGLEIWRINQFKVEKTPLEEYGKFYNKDSYIILHTRAMEETEDGYDEDGGPLGVAGLAYAIYFWLGAYTSIDKQGTAAYKTVELDDLMDQAARQHREVMGHESEAFKALFENGLMYLEGGTESGFRSVCDIDLNAYVARLLQVKKYGNQTVVVEVPCTRDSLNHGASFILDQGDTLYVWNGQQSMPVERAFARMAADELERARAGKATVTQSVDSGFWDTLGGYGYIASKQEAGESLPEPVALGDGVLYHLSDKTGQLYLTEMHRGALSVEMLLPSEVYICDPGTEVIVWVGEQASDREKRAAMFTATKYLALQGKPHSTPIKVFKSTADAMTDSSFAQIFAGTDKALEA